MAAPPPRAARGQVTGDFWPGPAPRRELVAAAVAVLPPMPMKLRGRILWLTDDPELLRAQLAGKDLDISAQAAPPLQFAVNTDGMISGAACTLGYTGDI